MENTSVGGKGLICQELRNSAIVSERLATGISTFRSQIPLFGYLGPRQVILTINRHLILDIQASRE